MPGQSESMFDPATVSSNGGAVLAKEDALPVEAVEFETARQVRFEAVASRALPSCPEVVCRELPPRPRGSFMGADCKSVGVAYPGSNPGSATGKSKPLYRGNAVGGFFFYPELPALDQERTCHPSRLSNLPGCCVLCRLVGAVATSGDAARSKLGTALVGLAESS